MNTKFLVGDAALITSETLENMVVANAHRSYGYSWLSDAFLDKARTLLWVPGEVTHIFPPAHETTMQFDGHSLHMKPHYAVRIHSMHGDFAIAYPGVLNRKEVEAGGSLHGFFRVIAKAGGQSSLYTEAECLQIIENERKGLLKGSFLS